MRPFRTQHLFLFVALLSLASLAAQQPMAADRLLARSILEELVEIPSTDTDGTQRVAEAITARH